jgi:glycosyltransferase involved in cell wall biosynthesis
MQSPLKISVVVPTLNEERYLPLLLGSLQRQGYPVHEIIIADGFSRDRTRAVALEWGCRVVDGPEHPGVGRNRGAAAATGDTLLFLDADVILPRGFLQRFVARFLHAHAVVATPVYRPTPNTAFERVSYFFGNIVMWSLQRTNMPLAAGYCIMIDRRVFEAVGGFDERLLLAEDHDLVRRAKRRGPFKVFILPIKTSTRRYQKQGGIRLSLRYIVTTLKVLAGKKVMRARDRVDYRFGEWE